jgi:hypothetical protein
MRNNRRKKREREERDKRALKELTDSLDHEPSPRKRVSRPLTLSLGDLLKEYLSKE